MEASFNKIENVVVLALKGKVDAANVSKLEKVCQQILDQGENNVLIDGTQLEFISSAGLRVLLKLAKSIKRNSGKLAAARLNDLVRQIFEISGFVELFPIYENVVTGLNHFQNKS